MIQTAAGIFSMSHCAASLALHHADELHPDLVVIPMQENVQTDKEPLSFRAGRGAFLLFYVLYLSGYSPLPPQSRDMYVGLLTALN